MDISHLLLFHSWHSLEEGSDKLSMYMKEENTWTNKLSSFSEHSSIGLVNLKYARAKSILITASYKLISAALIKVMSLNTDPYKLLKTTL